MHPDPAFAMSADEARAFAADVAFAHIFLAVAERPMVIHAPVTVDAASTLSFHIARRNRAMPIAAGTRAIASFGGPGAYVSPDWYEGADQVPTWNYVVAEAEGVIEPFDDERLIAHLDAASHAQESRLAPKPEWTRGKMDPRRFDAMRPAIEGFALHVEQWRGTAKLSQNKPAADVRGVIAGLRGAGKDHPADLVERANRARLQDGSTFRSDVGENGGFP
ncbi:FMN-binding negative transcriptional regulator [Sphingomonas sp. CL5.1]|uniref:FMN-binding negative transcriptional regulator n=1 Tax=Sphingomonas sp. CL5.1 TaxID=2653203 RepID=UPI0015840482|nr:FMN-binding negative transcriptional regulator [Sphingomonas sp. CL5.1]QKS00073.1 FMN-binding negative transcriptional regulator [Sphingomonas sp. CL5.1]